MPFPDLNTSGFTSGEDSSKFSCTPIDPSLSYETEGGLAISRRRFTRDPGYIITTGFTRIPNSDKLLLDTYYQSVSGGSYQFNYTHPVDGTTLVVRFESGKVYKTKYVGLGGIHYWDIDEITLRTV